MNAIGWILIIFLILVILAGVGLLIYYFAKIKPDQDKKKPSDNNDDGDKNNNVISPLSIVTKSGEPKLALSSFSDNSAVTTSNPEAPPLLGGILGLIADTNICPNYKWNYTGPTGSLEASWINTESRYMGVKFTGSNNTPMDDDKVVFFPLGVTGSNTVDQSQKQWTYDKSGLWCLTKYPKYCLYHTPMDTGATTKEQIDAAKLRIRNIGTLNKTDVTDNGFSYVNVKPLTPFTEPACRKPQ